MCVYRNNAHQRQNNKIRVVQKGSRYRQTTKEERRNDTATQEALAMAAETKRQIDRQSTCRTCVATCGRNKQRTTKTTTKEWSVSKSFLFAFSWKSRVHHPDVVTVGAWVQWFSFLFTFSYSSFSFGILANFSISCKRNAERYFNSLKFEAGAWLAVSP